MRGGEGETQLETDRHRVQDRIARLSRDLEAVRRQRATQRNSRQRNHFALASIVGYTNAGKSTLLNRLTGAEVLAEHDLFATLAADGWQMGESEMLDRDHAPICRVLDNNGNPMVLKVPIIELPSTWKSGEPR